MMKSKKLLLTLLMALLVPWAVNAQSVQVGDGTSMNSYLPSYSFYNYSLSQQIYTAEEIAASGNITSIAFYNGGTTRSRQFDIYMAHTTKTAFESTSDWIALTDADIVYHGTAAVAITAGAWTTFSLDTPFAYNGTDNLVVAVIDRTGSYESGMSCRVFTTEASQSLALYNDNYSSLNPNGTNGETAVTGTTRTLKNQIVLGGIQQAYPAPSNLTVSNLSGHGATLDWTENGTATSWKVAYKKNADENFTEITVTSKPYTFTGLDPETTYNVKVCAVYGGRIESGWSATVNFTTTVPCPAPTGLTATLDPTDATIATLTWTSTASDWVLEYGTASDFAGATSVNVSGTPSKELTGLTPETTYYARVKSVCGGDDGESTWSSTVSFEPTAKLVIGSGTSTSSNLPTTTCYNYSLTQQIYTAAELGEANAILSIDFYSSNGATKARNFDIYMVSTNKASFESTTDWIAVTAADLVYSATNYTWQQGWNTIELDVPFNYDGTSNVAIVMCDEKVTSYECSTNFLVFEATSQAIYARNDDAAYDPFDTSETTAYEVSNKKDQIRLLKGVPPTCLKPNGLTVNYTGGTEATVSWNSDATAWNMKVNGTPINGTITNPYTLTGLELATTYEVQVQANCGDATSEWAGPVSFTTDACESACDVTITLTDAYSDGGGQIQVLDSDTEEVLGTYTNSSASTTYTLRVCDGTELTFVYTSTDSWPYENGWLITDINGDVISEHVGCSSSSNCAAPTSGVIATYTVDCTVTPCRKPTNVAVTDIGKNRALLSWTENGEATAWNIMLNGNLIQNVTENPYSLTLEPSTIYTVSVSPVCEVEKWSDEVSFTTLEACPAPIVTASDITPASANVAWTGDASSYNLRYRQVDASQYAIIVYTADAVWGDEDESGYQMLIDADATAYADVFQAGLLGTSCDGIPATGYTSFEYMLPYNADPTCTSTHIIRENTLSIVIPAGTYDILITNPTPDSRIWFASDNGTIGGRIDDYTIEAGKVYTFHTYLGGSNDATDVVITDFSGVAEEWSTPVAATSPYPFTGLNPETGYEVQVQAVCGGEDGESNWASAAFSTLSNCETPIDLAVTNRMPTTVTVSWTGYQENYEIQYRPVAHGEELEAESFEGNLNGWTTIDADGDGYDWQLASVLMAGYTIPAHEGEDCVSSQSYDATDGALTPDNYLVSPQVELGGSITFWAQAQDATYASEHFGVAVSTTSNTDATAFTTIQEWTMTAKRAAEDCKSIYSKGNYLMKNRGNRASGEWYQYTVDLGAYEGMTGYVAIRHFDCSDWFYLNVDDVTIYSAAQEEGQWISLSVNGATTSEIPGLDPETTYEWQVRGENRNCEGGYTEWSEIAEFTTPGACDGLTNLTIDDLTATSITLSWTGYQESYLVQYRIAENITDATFEDTASEQGDWTTDNLAVVENEETGAQYSSGWEVNPGYFTFLYSDNPPQSLISPELTVASNSTLAFDYAVYSSEYPESFRVGFSTTTNDLSSFTWGEEVDNLTNDEYFETYYVAVPDGAKYFAIQYTANDMYGLILDNFVIGQYVPAGEIQSVVVEGNTVTIDGLTPNTLYELYLQGICGEDEYTTPGGGYFTTLEQTTLTQTITLTTGSNWFSTYLEITLEDLQNALAAVTPEKAITIKSQTANSTYSPRNHRWSTPGTFVWDVAKMYYIEMTEDCEITLEGMLINPAEHPITIVGNGTANWIGFPFNENMTITEAFAALPPTNNDNFKSSNGNSSFNRNRWSNNIQLEPGRGYLYVSAPGSADRPDFVYPTPSKAAKSNGKIETLSNKSLDKSKLQKGLKK